MKNGSGRDLTQAIAINAKSRTPWLHPSIGPQWVADFLENQSAQVRPKKMHVLT